MRIAEWTELTEASVTKYEEGQLLVWIIVIRHLSPPSKEGEGGGQTE